MALVYSCERKKVGGTIARAPWEDWSSVQLGFCRRIATREAGSWPEFRTNDLGIGTRRCLWRRIGRRARFFRQRFAFEKHFHFIGVQDFSFEQSQSDVFEFVAICFDDVAGF